MVSGAAALLGSPVWQKGGGRRRDRRGLRSPSGTAEVCVQPARGSCGDGHHPPPAPASLPGARCRARDTPRFRKAGLFLGWTRTHGGQRWPDGQQALPRVAGGSGWPRARQRGPWLRKRDLSSASDQRGWSRAGRKLEKNPSQRLCEGSTKLGKQAFSWETGGHSSREQVIHTASAGASASPGEASSAQRGAEGA